MILAAVAKYAGRNAHQTRYPQESMAPKNIA